MTNTTETYTYADVSSGAISVDVSDEDAVTARLIGAGANYPFGSDPTGGYIIVNIDVTNTAEIQLYPGQKGQNPNGGDGYYTGGAGGNDSGTSFSGYGGGGSTTILDGSGTELVHADGAGGGGIRASDDNATYSFGGGGGARGGIGGTVSSGDVQVDGSDGSGAGFGGDGGDVDPTANNGAPGGQEALDSRVTVIGSSTGGGNSGNGEITLIYKQSESSIKTSGWAVEITHPDTGRVRTPDVLDLQNAPIFNPGPNQLPRVRLPVPKDDVWLSDAYDGDPEMRVWRDGRRLPIEVLRDVEQLEGATVLVGVGGVELEQRVREEYDDDRRHLAVRDLVETETTYGDETPEPNTATLQDVVQQDPDSDAEFAAVSSFAADTPIGILATGRVTGEQICWTQEGEDFSGSATGDPGAPGTYSSGNAARLDSAGETAAWTFTPDHDIPAEHVEVAVRDDARTDSVEFEWRLNGNVIDSLQNQVSLTLGWTEVGDGSYNVGDGYTGPDLHAGTEYTLEVECTNGTGDTYLIDVVAPYDGRSGGALFFDDDNGGNDGYLDGPGLYAPQTATFDNAPSAFNVTAGSADITINNKSGAQRLQISNNNGSTWLPDNGSENNTTSVNVDYPTAGSGSRLRVTLDAYSPNGARSQTPKFNYASQELDAYTLRADISQELLLIEETFDNNLNSVLTAIGEPAERSWGLRTDANGDIVVRFTQNGQFDAEYTPEFSDRTREKLGKTYDSVTVKGSNEPESNIPYTASTTFSTLPRKNILAGSETVYDDTRNYERGDDYEINYQAGEIRATSGGDLVVGDAYRVDFRYQARGTFTSPDAPANPDELVTTVPGVTSQRLAEQVAFVLASEVDTARYAAEVTIPDPDPRFDPTDALPPTALGLPSGIGSLEVRGDPQLTEEGLAVRFGTRPPVEATQQRISRQLGRVSDRS